MEQIIIDLLERIRLLEVRMNREEVLEYNTAGGLSGSGSSGQVAYWTGASVLSGDALLFWDVANTRLGVGTGSPADVLEVSKTLDGTISGIINNPSSGGSMRVQLSLRQGANEKFAYSFVLSDSTGRIINRVGPVQIYTNNGGPRMHIDNNGNVGVNLSAFGASAVGILGILNGTRPTASITGSQFWSEIASLLFMRSGVNKVLAIRGRHTVSTTQKGNTAATETDLFSTSIEASTLGTNGDSVDFWSSGTFATSLATDKRIRVYFGGTTLIDTGALSITTTADWIVTGSIIRTGATTQKARVQIETSSSVLVATVDFTSPAETLSGAVTLRITGQGTNANDVVGELWQVDVVPTP